MRVAWLLAGVLGGCYDPILPGQDGAVLPRDVDGSGSSPSLDAAWADGAGAWACASPYQIGATGCYRGVDASVAWLEAEADCADDVPGETHLAVIDQPGETSVVAALVGNTWIGLVHDGVQWRWVTGATQSTASGDWQSGDPTGDGPCVRTVDDSWDDEACAGGESYVCERDGLAIVVSPM